MNDSTVGFIGLGIMGAPMATNLLRGGVELIVWARDPVATAALVERGARAAGDVPAVFAAAETVILMLRDEAAVDDVLGRDTERFGALVRDRTLVQMGTFAPDFSARLAREVELAGGRYVEAPVSGSRGPAVDGTLVAMLAGHAVDLERVEPLVDLMCGARYRCGAVPAALATKIAVNAFLITMVTGLAETFHLAERTGVDLEVLRSVLDAGPMASAVSRGKAAKLLDDDLSPQAAIADVLKNARLVEQAAATTATSHPLIGVSRELYEEATAEGRGRDDMIGVIAALRARTGRGGAPIPPA